MRYIGVDLHTNCFTVCILTESGRVRFQEYRLKELKAFVKTLQTTDALAVEATGNTRFFREAVAAHVAKKLSQNVNRRSKRTIAGTKAKHRRV